MFYAEEEEVEERDVTKDVELFQSACSDIQRTIMEIKALKESKDQNTVCRTSFESGKNKDDTNACGCIWALKKDLVIT